MPVSGIALLGLLQAAAAYGLAVGVPLDIVRLGGSPLLVGLAFTGWAAGRSATGLVAGRLFDGHGGTRPLMASLAAFGAVALLYAWAAHPWEMAAARFAQGLVAGVYWTQVLALLGLTAAGAERMRHLAVFSAAVAAGGILGSVAAGLLAARMGPRFPFYFALVASLAAALLARGPVETIRPAAPGPPRLGHRVVLLCLVSGLPQAATLFANAGLPLLLLARGGGASAVGFENALVVAGVLVVQTWAARHPRVAASRAGLAWSAVGTIAGLAAVGASRSLPFTMAGLAVLGTALNLLGIVWTHQVQSAAPPASVGRATGVMRSAGDGVSAALYPAVGWALASPEAAAAVLSVLVALSSLYGLRTRQSAGGRNLPQAGTKLAPTRSP